MSKLYVRALALLLAGFLLGAGPADPPRILIIGDSISIGYTPFVQTHFSGRASVEHNPGNAQHTGTGLKKLEDWIGSADWDIVLFNWGLWDLCYRHPDSQVYGHRDKEKGQLTFTVAQYRANLDTLVTRLKQLTDARLVFVTTTYVPPQEAGRFTEDPPRYNAAARAVMARQQVPVFDIYEASRRIHAEHGLGVDDVHYTEAGYRALGKLISDKLETLLLTGDH